MALPEATSAGAQHMAELFLAVRSVADAAPQCQLSLQQYHGILTAALAANPARWLSALYCISAQHRRS
jgi:hypothetical protein